MRIGINKRMVRREEPQPHQKQLLQDLAYHSYEVKIRYCSVAGRFESIIPLFYALSHMADRELKKLSVKKVLIRAIILENNLLESFSYVVEIVSYQQSNQASF